MPLRATFYAGGVGPYFLIGVPVLLLSLVAALTVRVWRRPAPPRPGRRAAAALLAFVVLDAGLVRALPALGKSYGPLLSAGAYLFCIRVGLYLLLLLAGLLEALRRLRPAGTSASIGASPSASLRPRPERSEGARVSAGLAR